jgi:hypothetical protein
VRARHVRGEQLAAGGAAVVQAGDLPVTLRVIAIGIDDNLAREFGDRDLAVVLQRDRDHDNVPGRRGLLRGPGGSVLAECTHELGKRPGPREYRMRSPAAGRA